MIISDSCFLSSLLLRVFHLHLSRVLGAFAFGLVSNRSYTWWLWLWSGDWLSTLCLSSCYFRSHVLKYKTFCCLIENSWALRELVWYCSCCQGEHWCFSSFPPPSAVLLQRLPPLWCPHKDFDIHTQPQMHPPPSTRSLHFKGHRTFPSIMQDDFSSADQIAIHSHPPHVTPVTLPQPFLLSHNSPCPPVCRRLPHPVMVLLVHAGRCIAAFDSSQSLHFFLFCLVPLCLLCTLSWAFFGGMKVDLPLAVNHRPSSFCLGMLMAKQWQVERKPTTDTERKGCSQWKGDRTDHWAGCRTASSLETWKNKSLEWSADKWTSI